jgi:hypothetical protein
LCELKVSAEKRNSVMGVWTSVRVWVELWETLADVGGLSGALCTVDVAAADDEVDDDDGVERALRNTQFL